MIQKWIRPFTGALMAAVLLAAGCDNGSSSGASPKTLSSIAITAPPAKIIYTVDERLDTTGMIVTATYSDTSTAEISRRDDGAGGDLPGDRTDPPPYGGYTIKGFDSRVPVKSQLITVSYTEGDLTKTATFTVTINAADPIPARSLESIAIASPPAKIAYRVGETLNTAGLAVTATYSDGTTAPVTGYTTSGFDSSSVGTKTVTVSYTEEGLTKTATFTVTINAADPIPARSLESLSIIPPTKTDYTVGDTLNISGLVVTARYSDGATADILRARAHYGNCDITGFDSSTPVKNQSVMVSYTEGGITRTATFLVTIYPTPDNVEITFTLPPDGITAPDLVFSPPQPATGYSADFTITVPPGFTSYRWLVDEGAIISTGTTNSFTVPVGTLQSGGHSVTVMVVKDGKSYSATKTFKVQ